MIALYLITLGTGLILDGLWLGIIMRPFYSAHLGHLMNDQFLWWAAALFYLLFSAGLIFFVIQPALNHHSLSHAIKAGAFLGLLCYATYNLTNIATLKDWPFFVSVVDTLWGTVFGTVVSGISFLIYKQYV